MIPLRNSYQVSLILARSISLDSTFNTGWTNWRKATKNDSGGNYEEFSRSIYRIYCKLQKRAHTNSTFDASLFMIYRKEKIRENHSLKKICESVRASPCSTMQLQVALGDLNGMILRLCEKPSGQI
jgi:hypothetical protein